MDVWEGGDPGAAEHCRESLVQAGYSLEWEGGGETASPGGAGPTPEGPLHPHP